MEPYFQNDRVTLHHGDALTVAAGLAPASVDCIVTSPPYYGLRDYGHGGQSGRESSPAEYVENLRKIVSGLWDVLTPGGTLWLNLGDSYANGGGGSGAPSSSSTLRGNGHVGGGPKLKSLPAMPARRDGVRSKNMLGIPWRVAFALQDDGWILRNDIIWNKTNAMPESVKDRVARRHEHIFMLTKSATYHYDLDAIREPHISTGPRGGANKIRSDAAKVTNGDVHRGFKPENYLHPNGKNPGDVWSIATRPFPDAHFAAFPPELPRRCILAGAPAGGTVLDPFHGSGTTGMVALEHGRKYVGIDVNAEYLDLSLETRLKGQASNV